jgi:hypothetical protein
MQPSNLLDWFFFCLLIAVTVMALWAFYYWWKKDHHTRERFAFFGFFALLGFGAMYLASLSLNMSVLGGVLAIVLRTLGLTTQPPSPLTPMEAVLSGLLFGGLIYAYLKVFTHWNGQKSLAQHEQEQNRETANVLRDVALLLSRDTESRKKRAVYQGDAESQTTVLEKPDSLAWHERARQLWLLRNRAYRFEETYDPACNCWLGEEKHTGALALLACYHQAPSAETLAALVDYAGKIAAHQARSATVEIILALKDADPAREESYPGYVLKYTSEAVLLENLVDFSDYFADLRDRVERDRLVDSDLTLEKTYTPSCYLLEKDGVAQPETLEDHVFAWLDDHQRRQLAVLGEYGQGKSTASLLLSYHLIQRAAPRIPILLELRGKTLRSMTEPELLATWAYRYRIDVQALLHLHLAGRLLLIFEGFDEIDLSGDTEARISHFRTLWRLNHENAKILITGRPNFFLDSLELKRALGTAEQTCTLYLAPFDLPQIDHSLRHVDADTRREILALAERDKKFREVVARPSLLYIVAVLWRREQLSQRQHINSAVVIDLFIRQTLRRQQAKHDQRPFMILNSAERHYFMTGIAAYMAAKHLPNQISRTRLEAAVLRLVEAIPDAVSQSVSTVSDEEARPLRSEARLAWQHRRAEVLHKIQTDVRSCGLLVSDLSKDGAFKFAHKSYMELLQAQVINQGFSADKMEQRSGRSIANTWKLTIADIQGSNEAIGFLAELLKQRLHERGLSEDQQLVNGLWEILVIGRFFSAQTWKTWLTEKWLWLSLALTDRLIRRFGVDKMERIVGRLLRLQVSVSVVIAIATAIAAIAIAIAMAMASFVVAETSKLFQKLVQQGWLWQEALLLILAVLAVYALLGSVIFLAADLLGKSPIHPLSRRLRLWYRACQDLRLPSATLEQIVGKDMLLLLAAQEQERRGE